MSLSKENKYCAKRNKLRDTREDLYYEVTSHLKQKASTTYPLYQTDFAHGTYIIDKPGTYKLMENIIFAPNPQHDFRPVKGDKYYDSRHYHLGFFAAIAIDSDDIIIDLNHKILQCSKEFQFSQRFYANIETNSAPFIKMQGPGNFGTGIKLPKYIWIRNGTLGRSSHHGLHGNGNSKIIVENVVSQDHEFIGFALNAKSDVYFKNCKALNNAKEMPVNALWSAALFLQQWVSKLIDKYPQLQASYDRLNNLISRVKRELFKYWKLISKDLRSLFANPQANPELPSLVDGNGYGFLVHPAGLAVHDFDHSIEVKHRTKNVFFKDCQVYELHCRPDEVIGISQKDGTGVQNDTAGAIFKIETVTDHHGHYQANPVADMQLALASLGVHISKINITPEIIEWANSYPAKNLQESVLSKYNYKYVCALDSMAHNAKGVVGIRLDAVNDCLIENCDINNIVNAGCLGCDDKSGNYLIDAPKQTRPGYNAINCYGIHLSCCSNVSIYRTNIRNIKSYNGQAAGIKTINDSNSIYYQQGKINGINAGYIYKDNKWYGYNHYFAQCDYSCNWPNRVPQAMGVDISDTDCKMSMCGIDIGDNIEGPLSQKINQGTFNLEILEE